MESLSTLKVEGGQTKSQDNDTELRQQQQKQEHYINGNKPSNLCVEK